MTRLLCLADSQIGSGRQLADDRLADQEQVLNAAADLAHERGVDIVLHLGDVHEKRHPDEEERMVTKRWLARLEPIRTIILAGNHDLSNTALASAVDLYDRCEFIRSPRILDLGGCSLACLPWAPIHALVAGRESTERTGANQQAAEALVAIIRDLARQREGSKPMILAAHWTFSGAHLPNGIPVEDLPDVVIPSEETEAFSLALCGHIHATGWFRGEQALYAGSPYPCSFGEVNQEHGVWLVDTDRDDCDFIPIASRRLVTIDCDLTNPLPIISDLGMLTERVASPDPITWMSAVIAEHDLTDATVRLRYRCTEEQAPHVNVPALKRQILAAGAHRIYSVEPTILRAGRERVRGLDETASPGAALDAWCEAQGVPQGQREGLHGLLQKWSA